VEPSAAQTSFPVKEVELERDIPGQLDSGAASHS